jgi:hypothetical protein
VHVAFKQAAAPKNNPDNHCGAFGMWSKFAVVYAEHADFWFNYAEIFSYQNCP